MKNIIAIDGPSGVGKSTAAKRVASLLNWSYMDTGAMYRAVTLALLRTNVSIDDKTGLKRVLASLDYKQLGELFFINGEDVSEAIRNSEVTKNVSAVSADGSVREALVRLQRELGKNGKWVVDGRDIGSVVFPDAARKIFLTASQEVRAQRRFLELKAKGIQTTFEEVLKDQVRRDHIDSTRDISPLRKADGAVELDSSNLSLEEVVDIIISYQNYIPALNSRTHRHYKT
ncbi:MAG: (d)CMP kinase [Holophagales bacterium]|jgi:cytidylate kinase|nr:(d)CMP kinase [Holophagales bacterium]